MMTKTLEDWQRLAASVRLHSQLFIDGQFVHAASDARAVKTNPATGDVLGAYALGNGEDIDRAVLACAG